MRKNLTSSSNSSSLVLITHLTSHLININEFTHTMNNPPYPNRLVLLLFLMNSRKWSIQLSNHTPPPSKTTSKICTLNSSNNPSPSNPPSRVSSKRICRWRGNWWRPWRNEGREWEDLRGELKKWKSVRDWDINKDLIKYLHFTIYNFVQNDVLFQNKEEVISWINWISWFMDYRDYRDYRNYRI